MSDSRKRQALQSRQAVLDAARRLFGSRGYDATSLQQIADELGMRKANVYYYFRTKEVILDALLAPMTDRLAALLGQTGDFETLNDQLCQALRQGKIAPLAPALLAHLRAMAIGQIAIDQPGYGGLAALLDRGDRT